MATFALIHGGGSSAWDWHLVVPLLEAAGHQAVAVDLPIEDENADLEEYARAVVDAVGERKRVIVVGHSLGGFTAPLVAEAIAADGLVYLTGMIPLPGETFTDWWTNTGHALEEVGDSPEVFLTGVPDALARESQAHEREQHGDWMSRPWPGERHPAVATRAIVCRDDDFFPAAFMRRQIHDRLEVGPVEISGGHYVALGNPQAVAEALIDFAAEIAGRSATGNPVPRQT